jgi:aryl-alcohol dehydrogenase-like predicted oxidoreductase
MATGQDLGQRRLGTNGPVVSPVGLGCMGMSSFYGAPDDTQSRATLRRALDLGVTLFDTSSIYGNGHNEELIGSVLTPFRDTITLSTKFGLTRRDDGSFVMDGRPEKVRSSCDESLRRLGFDVIDIYYAHRVDPTIPIEETVGAMAELVQAGKVRHLGLCEASPRSLERASAVHPIAVLQSEWSLWTRDIEGEVLETARRLGIGLVPYCPLGRGFLTGTIKSTDTLDPDDFRLTSPRFATANLARNLALVEEIAGMAADKHCSTAQLSLAWVLAQGDDVVPIPGTKRTTYLEQNTAAVAVLLTPDDLSRLDRIAPPGVAAGGRYGQRMAFGDSPEPSADM